MIMNCEFGKDVGGAGRNPVYDTVQAFARSLVNI
jgi:hypothetical protein